jgi:hypothetical protein
MELIKDSYSVNLDLGGKKQWNSTKV